MCVALTVFADLFGGAVCVMCCAVLVSAGRNVLDSVPPTHRPPTHGRLCIYTSGSSRSPQSLCSFKSLPCIYPSALFLSFSNTGFSGAFFFSLPFLQPNRQTLTHTQLYSQRARTHIMQLIKMTVSCALKKCAHMRVSISVRNRMQSSLSLTSVSRLCCSGRSADTVQL